jgi:hypothetical protein
METEIGDMQGVIINAYKILVKAVTVTGREGP